MIYHPELLTCPHCGDLLVTCNYLAWDKTVQRLDRVLSVASRPGHCPHATCVGSRLRLLSAEGQRLAPAGSTYGYDDVVHIGWWRQEARATYREIHAALTSRVCISESHVGYLYQQVYLPLLACHERQHCDRLAQIAQQQGGLIVALDGLAPQGGELCTFVAAMAEVFFRSEAPEVIFHDPLAAALIFEPSLCQTTAQRIEVDVMNGHTLGRTRPVDEAASKPHHVAHSVEVAKFFEHYFAIVGG